MVSILGTNQKRHQATFLLAVVVVAAGCGWAIPGSPELVLLGLVGLFLATVLSARPNLAIHLTMIAALTTLPAGIKTAIHPFGLNVDIWEPLLVVGLFYVRSALRPARWIERFSIALSVVVLVGALIGWWSGNNIERLFNEGRLFIDMIAAFYIAAGIARSGRLHEYKRTLLFVLWASAAVVVLASTTGFEVAGRQEKTHLGQVSSEATRLLTNTQFVGLAVLCGIVAVAVTRAQVTRNMLMFSAPCVVILFLSFSRNTVIALAITLVVGLLAARAPGRGVARIVLGALLIGGIGWLLMAAVDGTSVGAYLNQQWSAYNLRVLGGIGSEARATDPSALYRLQEDARLVDAFSNAPVFGHGFGFAYQPPFGSADSFEAGAGRYYAHNFYLWLLVKTGVVGAAVFGALLIAAVIRPIVRGVRGGGYDMGFVVASAALAGVCYVAPIPLDSPGSMIFGAVLGVAATAVGSAGSAHVLVEAPLAVERLSARQQEEP